jgi:hypothetical protein
MPYYVISNYTRKANDMSRPLLPRTPSLARVHPTCPAPAPKPAAPRFLSRFVDQLFSVLTFLTLFSLYALVVWGSIDTSRPRAPSISAMIADDVSKLVLYGVFVSVFIISRTGLVFTSTFYKLQPVAHNAPFARFRNFVRSDAWPKWCAVFGSIQLSGFIFVGLLSLNLHPTLHFLFTMIMAYMSGTLCELMLIIRRFESKHAAPQTRFWNVVVWVAMNVCLLTFGALSEFQRYSEIHTYSGLAEWFGFMLMVLLCQFRQDDVAHFKNCACCDKYDV